MLGTILFQNRLGRFGAALFVKIKPYLLVRAFLDLITL